MSSFFDTGPDTIPAPVEEVTAVLPKPPEFTVPPAHFAWFETEPGSGMYWAKTSSAPCLWVDAPTDFGICTVFLGHDVNSALEIGFVWEGPAKLWAAERQLQLFAHALLGGAS